MDVCAAPLLPTRNVDTVHPGRFVASLADSQRVELERHAVKEAV